MMRSLVLAAALLAAPANLAAQEAVEGEDDLPPVNGAESETTITAEGGEVEVVETPEAAE